MARSRDYPGQWSAIDWPLVCSERDDKGLPCHGRPVPGDHRCARHYGKIDGQAARKRRKLVDKFVGKGPADMKGISLENENALFKYGPQEKDPGVLLLEEVHRTAGIVLSLEDKVKELGGEDLVWGLREETSESGRKGDDSISMITRRYGAEVNTWYQLYKEERKHLAMVAAAAIKAGVEERRVRIAERGIDALEASIIAAFADLGLDPHSARVREVIGRRLAEALGGSTDIFGTDEGHRALEAARPPYIDAEVVESTSWGKSGPEEEF